MIQFIKGKEFFLFAVFLTSPWMTQALLILTFLLWHEYE
jgi:hypothetical protein